MKKVYEPLNMIMNGRYAVLYGKLAPELQRQVLAIQPREERFKGARFLGWVLVVLSMLILVAVAVISIWDGVKQGYGFWQFFWRCLVILYIYKAFDLVFLDWVLLQKTRFFQHYYPETEGCAGYHSYGFNKKRQGGSFMPQKQKEATHL